MLKNIFKKASYTLIILLVFICTNVNAETYVGDFFADSNTETEVYINKKLPNGTIYWQRANSITQKSTGANVYCLQPTVELKEDGSIYNVTIDDFIAAQNLTEQQYDRIMLLAYYGYGYGNHNSIDWIAVTQTLIWRTVRPDMDIYFSWGAQAKNRDDTIFIDKINELNNLVDNHYVRPSFNGTIKNISIGKSETIKDLNNVLGLYNIKTTSNLKTTINDNLLKITSLELGSGEITFKKKENRFGEMPLIFYASDNQNIFKPGDPLPVTAKISINVTGGKIQIKKVDSETQTIMPQGDGNLVGAKYDVFDSNNSLVSTLTINDDSIAITDYLPYGTYYIKETESSMGYLIDDTVYKVEIKSNEIVNINVSEKVIKGKIKIKKIDSENGDCNPQGEAKLNGAVYNVFNSKNELIDSVTIDNECEATTKFLPYGKYTISEAKPSLGYNIDTTKYEVEVRENEKIVDLTVKEDVIKGRIKVEKIDSDTNESIPQGQASLTDAEYEIYDQNGKFIEKIITNNEGQALSNLIPYGQYVLKEIKASNGYLLDEQVYTINISSHNEIVTIKSKEKVIRNFISVLKQYEHIEGESAFLNAEKGIIFEIYSSSGDLYSKITTDINGYATIELPYGNWKFHQVNSNVGFTKIYDFYVTVDENSESKQYYNILNNKISSYLKVIKFDSETGKTIELSGAKFKILNLDTNQYVSQYVAGKVLDTFITDENGTFTTYLKLEAGNYRLVEINSPTGYLLSNEGIDFTIGEDSNYFYTTYGPVITVKFSNVPIKGQIIINKFGENLEFNNGEFNYSEIFLPNVEFQIYANEDILSPDGKHLYYSKNQLIDTIVTNQNGCALSEELPLGEYKIVEISTDDEHVLLEQEYIVNIESDNNQNRIIYNKINIKNYLKKGKIHFSKVDSDTSEGIPNTEIEIYTIDNQLIYRGKTDKNGILEIEDIKIGKYYLLEKKSAYSYLQDTQKHYFEIKENDQIVTFTMTNDRIYGKIVVTKFGEIFNVDHNCQSDNCFTFDKNIELQDVTFGLYALEDIVLNGNIKYHKNELVSSTSTDQNGQATFDKLFLGKYYIKEVKTPNNYVLDQKKYIVNIDIVDNPIVLKEISVENYLKKGTLEFIKMDYDTNTVLANAQVNIYNYFTDELLFTKCTDVEGRITLKNIPYGKYYILETVAPENYEINSEKFVFEIQENEEKVQVIMTDKYIIEVPDTYSQSNNSLIIISVILGMIGIYMIGAYNSDKKKK